MKNLLLLFMIILLGGGVLAQSKMSPALLDDIDLAVEEDRTVKSLVMLTDRVDIATLNEELYAQNATLQQRASRVINALQEKATTTQGEVLAFLGQQADGDVAEVKPFWIANMIAVEATPSVIYALSERTDVGFINLNGILERDIPVDGAPMESIPNGVEPGLDAINARAMWDAGFTGQNTIVMNLDTGVNGNHPAFGYRWRGNHVPWDQAWFDPVNGTQFPQDWDNHGSHTMGTMCGLDPATNDTIGVAYDAEWIASPSLMAGSHTDESVASFEWAMDPDNDPETSDDMPAAICNSWFDPSISSGIECNPAANPYIPVIEALEAAGVAVIFSAGNSGPGGSSITSPKNVNLGLVHFWATGAVDVNNVIASFSSRGPVHGSCITGDDRLDTKPEAVAPGVNVRSAYNNGYGNFSGTSMAAPHVAGAVALLRSALPDITGTDLKLALYETADDLGTAGEDNNYGMGIINVWSAFLSFGAPASPDTFSAYSDYQTPDGMNLSWEDPTHLLTGDTLMVEDFSVIIERDGEVIDSVAGGTESYFDTGLMDGQEYTYSVFARIDSNHAFKSPRVDASWIAGGSPIPNGTSDFNVSGNDIEVSFTWTNPSTNLDGTPMDDLYGVNLYRNGVFEAFFERTTADTGAMDQQVYELPVPGLYEWYVTVVDNEVLANESEPSEVVGTPLSLPVEDNFDVEGDPNPGQWLNTNADINDNAMNPLSGPYALNLNGKPNGGDTLDLKPLDLSEFGDALGVLYYWQPEGTGDGPEEGDSLSVYFKNDLGEWHLVRQYPGMDVQEFEFETIFIDAEDAGEGTFYHSQFQVRFTSMGGAGSFANDNWFIDDFSIDLVESVDELTAVPTHYDVEPNFPNPFNPTTTIRYQLPASSEVTLSIYNMLGQQVRELVGNDLQAAGHHEVVWDATNESGAQVASGIYVYRFEAKTSSGQVAFTKTQKMVLLK